MYAHRIKLRTSWKPRGSPLYTRSPSRLRLPFRKFGQDLQKCWVEGGFSPAPRDANDRRHTYFQDIPQNRLHAANCQLACSFFATKLKRSGTEVSLQTIQKTRHCLPKF